MEGQLKCTRPPWHVERLSEDQTDSGEPEIVITAFADADGRDGWIVATINDPLDDPDPREGIANAHLIAASPDLYESLKEARSQLDPFAVDLSRIDAALMKAEAGKEV